MVTTNPKSGFIARQWANPIIRIVVFAFAYIIVVNAGLFLVTQPEGISVIWPASGVALAALLLSPRREWPILFGIIFAVNLISNLMTGASPWISAGFAFANTLEPALGSWVITRWLGRPINFERLSDVLILIVSATLVNGLTALLGALVPTLAQGAIFRDTWVSWWILDGVGILALTPLIVTWVTDETPILPALTKGRRLETLIWLVVLCGTTWFMFGMSGVDIYLEPRPYMLFPIIVWMAMRFSARASATALMLMGMIALGGTVMGMGSFPLGGDTPREQMIAVQGFFAVASMTALLLSATFNERRVAEKSLKQSEKRFRALIENGADAITLLSADGAVLYEGPTVERLTGYTKEDRVGKSGMENVYPEDVPVVRQTLGRVLSKPGLVASAEFRSIRKDGTIWWTEASATNLLNDPNVQAIVTNYRDITERKEVEAELKKSEIWFRSLFEKASDGIFYLSMNSDLMDVNHAFARMHGYTVEEMRKMNLKDLDAPETAQQFPERMRRTMAGEIFTFEVEHYHKDGHIFPLEVTTSTITVGEQQYVLAFHRDITERKQAENALREQEFWLRESQRVSHTGTYRLDIRTGEWKGTQTLDELFGIKDSYRKDIQGWLAVVHPEQQQEMLEYFQNEVIGAKGHFNKEYRIIQQANHVERWVYGRGELEFDESGAPIAMLGTIQDITERKQAELEREKLLDELERKNKELESLIYIASHDLRSPLVNIQGFGRNLRKYFGRVAETFEKAATLDDFRLEAQPILTERIPSALHFIEAGSAKMDSLIAGLLRVSRIGRAILQMKQVDMNLVIQNILDTMAFQIEKVGVQVYVEKPLAECYADKDQINQVFSNLLDNAVKYRNPDRPLNITISSRVERREVIYVIEDSGMGIAPENQDKIWELFHRLEGDVAIPGEGLGLTLARRIVERHGGRMWVESEPGVGSRFYVELPAKAQTR